MLTNETKLLAYKDIRVDDRILTVLKENFSGKIVVYYPNIISEPMDENEEIMLEKCSESFIEEHYNHGRGNTIQEALADYVNFLNGKTVCFNSDPDGSGSYYFVTFNFDDIYNFDQDYDDIDGEIENYQYRYGVY